MVGPPKLIDTLWGYHDYTSIGPTILTDRLAALALEPTRHARLRERTRLILRKNYPLICNWLSQHQGLLKHVPPAAGAIAWVGCGGWNSIELAEQLRARKGVLLVPGGQFGVQSYLRIGFGGHADQLQQALTRLDELLAEYK